MYKELSENLTLVSQLEPLSEHKDVLHEIRNYIQKKHSKGEIAKLVFICTHNSRRSHIAQFLAWACSAFFHISKIEFYSGGTEVTAFHENAVQALQKFGFRIRKLEESQNPRYEVYLGNSIPPLIAFSKLYGDSTNPQKEFTAIMVCDNASENCPVVYGAEKRFKLTYSDPKIFDNENEALTKYYEKVLEIARDMIYLFSRIKKYEIM